MSVNFEPLRKILELEQKKGYVDSAVIGGLDRFLHNWASQAAGSITQPGLLKRFRRLAGAGYGSLTREQRKEWVSDALGSVFVLNILYFVSYGVQRLIPGNPLPYPFSPFAYSFHRVLEPARLVNILSGGTGFLTYTASIMRAVGVAFHFHKFTVFDVCQQYASPMA